MRAQIELQSLHALHAGEATAEPYLWPLFFRIDEEVYAEGLRAASAAGELSESELAARGFSKAALHSVPAPQNWCVAPGGDHGNVPPMKTGDRVELKRSFVADLALDHGLLHPAHAVVGCVVLLFEEDRYPGGGKVRSAYAAWADATRRRFEKAVRDSIKSQTGRKGRFSFGLRAADFVGRSDTWDADRLDYLDTEDRHVPEQVRVGLLPDAPLDPPAIERELTRKFQDHWDVPLVDADDFIGALFWARTVGELQRSGPEELKKLWTPTTGSREGSWELFLRAALAGS